MRNNNARFTIHAGEAFGRRPSMRRWRSAGPTGWGTGSASSTTSPRTGRHTLWAGREHRAGQANSAGDVPEFQRADRAAKSIAEHPFDLLARLRFRVTVNTDNRLMSDTTMTDEMARLVEAFGYGWSDLERFTINAMKSAFIRFDERLAIIDEVIKPRYAVLIG